MTRACAKVARYKPTRMLAAPWTLVCGMLLVAMSANAEYEIAPFKLENFAADFSVRYSLDDRTTNADFTRSNLWREELGFYTRSYIYHPALLDMNISGGLVFLQDSYEEVPGKNSENEILFNYDARFDFLSRKVFPFSVYVSRQYPEMTTNLLGRYLAKTDRYGLGGRVRSRERPMTWRWDVNHVDTNGSGFGSTVDESIDRATVGTQFNYDGGQSLSIDLNWLDRLSRSGSAGLPIQESINETVSANLRGNNVFGSRRQVSLRQYLGWLQQDTTTIDTIEVNRLSYTSNLNWNHTERLESRGSYSFRDENRSTSQSRNQDVSFSTSFRAMDEFYITGLGRYGRNEDPGFEQNRGELSVRGNYRVPLSIGTLAVNGEVVFGRTDQEATVGTVRVFDESHVLGGIVPVALNAEFIVTVTVVVTNLPQTQTFVEGLDYRLETIGSTTTIERIVTGNIFDGQEVLVGYEYRPGGTAEYNTRGKSLSFNLTLNRFARVYAQWIDTTNETVAGNLTVPLNDRARLEAGAALEVPLLSGWSVGGRYRYYLQDEDIAPSDGTLYDLYAKTGLYWRTSAQFGITKETVDNEFSTEDVSLLRYFVSVACRLPGSSRLTYTFNSAEDDGGSLVREDSNHRLQFDWRYRRVMFSLQATRTETAQGASQRDQTRVSAELRRRF